MFNIHEAPKSPPEDNGSIPSYNSPALATEIKQTITRVAKRALETPQSGEKTSRLRTLKPEISLIAPPTQREIAEEYEAGFFTSRVISLKPRNPPADSSEWLLRCCALIEEDPLAKGPKAKLTSVDSGLGLSSSFFLISDKKLAVIKPGIGLLPTDTRVLRQGISPHDMVIREECASVIARHLRDLGIETHLPETAIISISSSKFPPIANLQEPQETSLDLTCSIQQFRENIGPIQLSSQETLPNEKIRTLAILDILLNNTDRRIANCLIGEDGNLIPIDHALTLSKSFKDSPLLFWLAFDGSNTAFSREEQDSISQLDWKKLETYLLQKMPYLDQSTLKMLNTTVAFLKIGAELGLTPYELGCFMTKSRLHHQEISFLEFCNSKATSSQEDFSVTITQALVTYLAPCATILKNPSYQELHQRQEPKSGVKSYILQACSNVLTQHLSTGSPFSFETLASYMDEVKRNKDVIKGDLEQPSTQITIR